MGLFSLIGSIIGGNKQAKAADKAAQLQFDATKLGIDESRRQFDLTRSDYAPYQGLGTAAIPHLGDIIGLNGADKQGAEIAALKSSPLYQSLFNNGRDAMLATASATGGLRGGNFQDASQRFGADTLSSIISQQIANYGAAVGVGSGATDAVSTFGANAVNAQNDLRNQGAAAQAQAKLIGGAISAKNWKNGGSFVDSIASAAAGGGGGGGGGFNWSSLF